MSYRLFSIKVLALWVGLFVVLQLNAQAPLSIFEAKGKKGLKDSQGNIVVPAQYDICREVGYAKNWIVAGGGKFDKTSNYMGGTWAVLDRNGNAFIEPQPYEIDEYTYSGVDKSKASGFFVMRNADKKSGLINPSGKQILPTISENIGQFDFSSKEYYLKVGMIPYKVNGLWGVIDTNGNEILKPEHLRLENFGDHSMSIYQSVVIEKEGKKIGLLSANNKVVPAIYDSIWLVNLNSNTQKRLWPEALRSRDSRNFDILKVSKDGETFYVNDANVRLNGNLLSKAGDYAISVEDGKLGAVKISDGTEAIPFQYTELKYFEAAKGCDVFAARENGKWLCLDASGTKITDKSYDSLFIYTYSGTMFNVTDDVTKATSSASWGLFDKGKDTLYYVNRDCKMVSNPLVRENPSATKPVVKTTTPPTELQKEVGRIANSFAPQKQEYRECMYCSGTGKSKEKQRTYKNCSVCGGGKRISFGTRTGVCTVCDKYGKEIDKEWYPECQFCKGTGKLNND